MVRPSRSFFRRTPAVIRVSVRRARERARISGLPYRARIDPVRSDPSNMRRRLNLRWLAYLVGVGAVLGVGGHFLRGYQVRRTAGSLRDRAYREAEAEKYDEATKSYRRYLALVPDDADALADYGLTLDRTAKTFRDRQLVYFALERALQLKADREDARRRLVNVAM